MVGFCLLVELHPEGSALQPAQQACNLLLTNYHLSLENGPEYNILLNWSIVLIFIDFKVWVGNFFWAYWVLKFLWHPRLNFLMKISPYF